MSHSYKHYQRGAALIMALLLVAIVAAISISIASSQQVSIDTQIMTEDANQAYRDASYAQYWALQKVQTLQQQQQMNQALPQWPIVLPRVTLENGDMLEAQLLPATGLFNINNLATPISPYITVFTNLLQAVDSNITAEQAQKITKNVQAWVLPAQQAGPDDSSYASMSPPYQVAHQLMADVSELRLVSGITPLLYNEIKSSLITLPNTNTSIDINSAGKPLLMALFNNNASAAEAVMNYRVSNGSFTSTSQLMGLPEVAPYFTQNQNLNTILTIQLPTIYELNITIIRQRKIYSFQLGLQLNLKNGSMLILWQNQGN